MQSKAQAPEYPNHIVTFLSYTCLISSYFLDYGPAGGYNFRTTPSQLPAAANTSWAVHPNPVVSALAVDYPGTITQYQVTDVLGHTLLHGSLRAGSQSIDVSGVPPGNYVITARDETGETDHATFAKQ
jgi:type IX secretion system substrate protein